MSELTTVPTLAVKLRLATAADVPAINALTNRAYRVEDFFINGNRTNEPEVASLLGQHVFIVAEGDDGGLCGSVFVRVEPPRGYFGMLSVDPARQRNGLGRRLIEAAENRATDAGCSSMDLTVVHLRTELPPYYCRLGYIETGTEPFPEPAKLSQPAHFLTMSKPLAGATPRAKEIAQ